MSGKNHMTNPLSHASRLLPAHRTRMLIAIIIAAAGAPAWSVAQDADSPQPRQRALPDGAGDEGVRTIPRTTQPAPGTRTDEGRPGALESRPVQPNGEPRVQMPTPRPGEDEIVLPVFAEALDLRVLVDYVAETLGINIAAADELVGTVTLAAPMTVHRDNLLDLLDGFLEHNGYTIVPDRLDGWFKVVRMEGVGMRFHGIAPTSRIIPTPTLRPSSLEQIISTHLGAVGGRPPRMAFLDELGVIVITDTPHRIDLLVDLVTRVLERSAQQQFIRFDLQHIAASVARQRVLDLIGQAGTPMPGMPVQPGTAIAAGTLAHLTDRLTIDQQGNALILRGYPEEADRVEGLLNVIDVPHQLEPRQYFAGTGAMQIAQMAERFGFGRVEMLDEAPAAQSPIRQFQVQTQPGRPTAIFPQQQQAGAGGGPMLVVDAVRGTIIYYGTRTQHQSLEELINIFEAERELIEIRAYKVKNLPATDVAELLQGLIMHTQPIGRDPFLPGAGRIGQPGTIPGARTQPGTTRTQPGRTGQQRIPGRTGMGAGIGHLGAASQPADPAAPGQPAQPGAAQPTSLLEGPGALGGDDVFILADRFNNQVLVKAPARQQEEFAALIDKLDQRRPQVYIEVQIVSVSATDDFRLAFETQLINAQGRGGVLSTNFGLSTVPAGGGDIRDPKTVPLGLSGLTAALIRNDQVPIIINALRREADTRILSSPRLLVDDNEVAEIVSLELQPTTGSLQGVATTQVAFTGFEEAGTRLMVTPSISDGGYLRLQYAIELSNFVGVGTTTGDGVTIPPPKQTREVNSDSVTIPADTTIIVGGIEVDSQNKTVLKVPLLGDIPLIGHLFRDTGKSDASTRLYVFITPRILRDPTFRDLILLTRGPQVEAGVGFDLPALEPVMIELIAPEARRFRPAEPFTPTPRPSPFDPFEREPARLEDPLEN